MREIKFRGKNRAGEWLYGSLIEDWLNGYCEWFIGDKMMPQAELVEESTVGQFTGLKDNNGKEIYEGDIVSNGSTTIYSGDKKQTFKDVGVVRWDIKNGCIVINNEKSTKRLTHKTIKQCVVKVIGNIYDNPELMEVQE